MNLGEFVARVRSFRASSGGTEASTSLTYIKDTINSVYREVQSQSDIPPQENEAIIELQGAFTDGYLSATVGLNVVTLHDTSTYTGFTYAHWGGKLHIGDTGMYYTVEKTSLGTADPHYAYLDRPYQGTTTGSIGFSLYTDFYPLPGDLKKIDNCRLGNTGGYMIFSRHFSDYDVGNVTQLKYTPSGNPTQYTVWKQRRHAWFNSTATLTNGSPYVTFGENSSYYGITNWANRVLLDSNGDRYRIKHQVNTALSDALQVEMDRNYAGTTAASAAVLIDPKGTLLIQFYPVPTGSNTVVVKYTGTDHELVNDLDEPLLPPDNHDVIWKGAIYYMALYDGTDPNLSQQLYRDWMESRRRLDSYRTIDRDTVYQRRAWGGRRIARRYNLPDYVGLD